MSRDHDTLEDVVQYACAIDAISTPMQDKLLAELEALRARAPRGWTMTYTLAEIRNGTGFPKGARFMMVPPPERGNDG